VAVKTNLKLWLALSLVLFVASWFIPFLHDRPESEAVSPAVLVFIQFSACTSGVMAIVLMKFIAISFVASTALGWLMPAILRNVLQKGK
jgi:hypothetical protein